MTVYFLHHYVILLACFLLSALLLGVIACLLFCLILTFQFVFYLCNLTTITVGMRVESTLNSRKHKLQAAFRGYYSAPLGFALSPLRLQKHSRHKHTKLNWLWPHPLGPAASIFPAILFFPRHFFNQTEQQDCISDHGCVRKRAGISAAVLFSSEVIEHCTGRSVAHDGGKKEDERAAF